MADSEKLTALKKAYAEIILNTAKEAAARVMVSERKAERYRRELVAAKDEALRMLLRLKSMLDSKASEAEMTAMIQSKRIEELEAQLGEAEDIVKDLRSELRELQDELESLTTHDKHPPAEQISEVEIAPQPYEDSRSSPSGSAMSSRPTVEHEPIVSLEIENSIANGIPNGYACCSHNSSLKDHSCLCNSDFPSILIRRKEPELYRNGCTHRVRASERSLYDGSLSLPGRDIALKNQVNFSNHEADVSKKLSGSVEVHDAKESLEEVEEVEPDINCANAHALMGSGKTFLKKRKINPVSGKACPDMGVDQSVEGSTVYEERSQEVSESFPTQEPLSSSNDILSSGIVSLDISKSGSEFLRACAGQSNSKNEKLKDKVELNGGNVESVTRSGHADARMDIQMPSVLNLDPKESHATESPSKPFNDRVLKHTFQRKRKREIPSSPERDSSLENGISKGQIDGKQCDSQQSQKPDLITVSSRVDERAEQVA